MPIICIGGGYGDEFDLETIGVDRMLEKPVDMELVMRTVDELLAGNCA